MSFKNDMECVDLQHSITKLANAATPTHLIESFNFDLFLSFQIIKLALLYF